MLRILTAVALALCLAAGPARAQYFWSAPQAPAPKPPAQSPAKLPAPGQAQPSGPPQPPAQTGPAPYDHDLQRLSEILGALHFLRGICGTNEGQKWRTEAQALIDAEAPNGDRHDQMVASFNRGYRGFQQSYRTCTPAAGLVIRRYLEEGAKIARDITARYAN
ncbi:MAG: TIGR02301 family protein [Xanthobacteraceae bacterium]